MDFLEITGPLCPGTKIFFKKKKKNEERLMGDVGGTGHYNGTPPSNYCPSVLQRVLILMRSPRLDCPKLRDLSEHGNTIVFDEVAKSGFSEQIKIGQMDTIMTKTSDQIHQVFGSRFLMQLKLT